MKSRQNEFNSRKIPILCANPSTFPHTRRKRGRRLHLHGLQGSGPGTGGNLGQDRRNTPHDGPPPFQP